MTENIKAATMSKKLERVRDESAEAFFRYQEDYYWQCKTHAEALNDGFKKGFNAASDIYLPVVMELIEAFGRTPCTGNGKNHRASCFKCARIAEIEEKLGLE